MVEPKQGPAMHRLFTLILTFAALTSAHADVDVRVAQPGTPAPSARIADVAWLEGTWLGEGLGGQAEEAYASPLGGAIVGYFRFVKDGKPVFYEIVTIVETNGTLAIRLKHFHPDLRGWEEKDVVQEFKLVALEGQTAYFDGMTVKRDGDALYSAVRIRAKDGGTRVEQFVYKRKR
jgi:hypothetical protein